MDQYGGIKGSGPEHFLAVTWQEILDNLDHGDGAATALTSIDFAKAFNRMSHQACLRALSNHGAEDSLVTIVSSFLYNRTMVVKLGNNFSNPKKINGGSPQGSILGNYLFCITTDRLGDNEEHEELEMVQGSAETPGMIRRNRARTLSQPHNGRPGNGNRGEGITDTINFSPPEQSGSECTLGSDAGGIDGMDSDEDEFRFFRFRDRLDFESSEEEVEMLGQEEIDYLIGVPENWVEKRVKKCIYIDDYNCVEKVRERDAIQHLSQSRSVSLSHARQSEMVYNKLQGRAENIGMVVNDKKTQM